MGFLNRFLSGISSGDKFAKDCQKLGRPKVRRIVCFYTPPSFLTLLKTLTQAILGLQTVVKISAVKKSAQFGYNFWKYFSANWELLRCRLCCQSINVSLMIFFEILSKDRPSSESRQNGLLCETSF